MRLILFTYFLIFSHHVYSNELRICHISSYFGSQLPGAKDSSLKFSGFESNLHKKINLLKFTPKHKLDVIRGVEWAKLQKCKIVVGIITSQDALLAAPLLEKNGMFGISATSTTHLTDKWSNSFKSLSVSSRDYVDHLSKHFKSYSKKIYVISKKGDLYSETYRDLLILKKLPNLEFIFLEDLKINVKSASHTPTTLVFTTYPVDALTSILNLNDISQYEIYGTPSWNETHLFAPFFERINQKGKVQIWDALDRAKSNSLLYEFLKSYKSKFGRLPDHDSIYEQDVMRLITQCGENSNFSSEKTISCMKDLNKFQGISGRHEFKKGNSHSIRDLQLITLDKEYISENKL